MFVLKKSSRERGDRNNRCDNDDDDGCSAVANIVEIDRRGETTGLFEEASSNRRCRALIARAKDGAKDERKLKIGRTLAESRE